MPSPADYNIERIKAATDEIVYRIGHLHLHELDAQGDAKRALHNGVAEGIRLLKSAYDSVSNYEQKHSY